MPMLHENFTQPAGLRKTPALPTVETVDASRRTVVVCSTVGRDNAPKHCCTAAQASIQADVIDHTTQNKHKNKHENSKNKQ